MPAEHAWLALPWRLARWMAGWLLHFRTARGSATLSHALLGAGSRHRQQALDQSKPEVPGGCCCSHVQHAGPASAATPVRAGAPSAVLRTSARGDARVAVQIEHEYNWWLPDKSARNETRRRQVTFVSRSLDARSVPPAREARPVPGSARPVLRACTQPIGERVLVNPAPDDHSMPETASYICDQATRR